MGLVVGGMNCFDNKLKIYLAFEHYWHKVTFKKV